MTRRAASGALLLLITAAASAEVRIRVVEGDAAINSIRLRRAHDPLVQVLDTAGRPIAGATVTFLLPATGPSATFQDKSLSLTLATDADGMAASRGMRPNNVAGQFRIRVTASWRGDAGNATLLQTNVEPVKSSVTGKRVAVLALIGGAAVGGLMAATHGGGGSSAPAATQGGTAVPGSTIAAGTPSIGPPH